MKLHPDASCLKCSELCKIIKYNTFSYWWCDKCKDEADVILRDIVWQPKGALWAGSLSREDDLIIDKPGYYEIDYRNGNKEWYHHRKSQSSVRLPKDEVSRVSTLHLPPTTRPSNMLVTSNLCYGEYSYNDKPKNDSSSIPPDTL